MSLNPHFPDATRDRLRSPAPPGQRHAEIVTVASALIGNGWLPEAAFCQIRPNYGADIPDAEIQSVIEWAANRIPGGNRTNYTGRSGIFGRNNGSQFAATPPTAPNKPVLTPETAIEGFLSGFRCTEADLWESSPVRLPENWERDAEAVVSVLFRQTDRINVVWETAFSGAKPQPVGYGLTRKQSEWIAEFRRNGPPSGLGGCWIRLNPLSGAGVSDTDVTDYRFLLLEADDVPLALQIAFFARLPLPITAIISSGGRSLHAWVQVKAPGISEFRETAARIFRALEPFGIDQANKNPGRLSRLPGVNREIGGIGQKRQRLLYLNPNPECRPIID
jgi:hypothetical protein